jgi:hypothetical protein
MHHHITIWLTACHAEEGKKNRERVVPLLELDKVTITFRMATCSGGAGFGRRLPHISVWSGKGRRQVERFRLSLE